MDTETRYVQAFNTSYSKTLRAYPMMEVRYSGSRVPYLKILRAYCQAAGLEEPVRWAKGDAWTAASKDAAGEPVRVTIEHGKFRPGISGQNLPPYPVAGVLTV
jgi:hypothetical protein